jgi:hypothetical protein
VDVELMQPVPAHELHGRQQLSFYNVTGCFELTDLRVLGQPRAEGPRDVLQEQRKTSCGGGQRLDAPPNS